MFCSKCGNQIPDGGAFCPNCGNKIEVAPVAAPVVETPVAAPVVEAPAAEAPVAAPVVEAPAAPVAAPVQPPVAPQPAPKKKGKTLLIVIIAVVAALAVTAGALYFTGVFDNLFGTSQSDKDDKDDKKDKDGDDGDEDDTQSAPGDDLIGTWEADGASITFKKSGKGTINEDGYTESFKWEIKKGKLYMENEDGDERIFDFSVTSKKLTLTNEDGDKLVMYKKGTTQTTKPDYEEPDYEEPDYEEPDYDEPDYEVPDYDEPDDDYNQGNAVPVLPPNSSYDVGAVAGNYYTNSWADLKFEIPSGWANKTSDFQTGSTQEDIGLYLQSQSGGIVVEVGFTKTSLSTREYMIQLRDDLEVQMTASGFGMEYSDLYEEAEVAGHDGVGTIAIATTANGDEIYIALFTYRVGDYAVLINVTALSEDDMNDTMEAFSSYFSGSLSYGDDDYYYNYEYAY